MLMSGAMPRILGSMARKKKFTEVTPARFAPGTFDRIERVLGATEDRADFIRDAVETELEKREREAKRAAKDGGGNG
jgi:hypothetical protein